MSSNEPHASDVDVTPVDLADFDNGFVESELQESEFESIPDGKYEVNVERVELVRAQTSGRPMVRWTLRVLGPQHRGRLVWRNSVISERSLGWLKTDLHVCGLTLAKLSDLPNRLGELLDVKLAITKRTKGENENIYFNRRLTEVAEGPDCQSRTDQALEPF